MTPEIAFEILEDVVVGGLDVGQIKVGVASIVRGSIKSMALQGENTASSRYSMSVKCIEFLDNVIFNGTLCIEDYTNQRGSFTAFGVGEFGGMVRALAFAHSAPVVFIRPRPMQFLLGVGGRCKTRPGKKIVKKYIEDNLGWLALEGDAIDRENKTDAVGYAFVAACVEAYRHDMFDKEKFTEKERNILGNLWVE